jgi:hypothetical protein
MIIVNCEQGSPEWHQERAGAITASNFKLVRERLKSGPDKGDYKKEAHDYAFRLAVERLSQAPLNGNQFEPYEMRRGRELEPEARMRHEEQVGELVEQAGIVLTDDRKFGGSADGLIGSKGGSEYKCFLAPEKLRSIVLDADFSDVEDQIQGCMWLTGREWWHFVLYCPPLASVGKDLVIHERERDNEYIEVLEADLLAFDGLVRSYMDKLQDINRKEQAA